MYILEVNGVNYSVTNFTALWKFFGSIFEYFTRMLHKKNMKTSKLCSRASVCPDDRLSFLERIRKIQNSSFDLLKIVERKFSSSVIRSLSIFY